MTKEEEVYKKVYGKLVNTVLPAFNEAVIELQEEEYKEVGDFMVTSIAGITATVLQEAVITTSEEFSLSRSKARKKVINNLNELTNLFLMKLEEINDDTKKVEKALEKATE